MFNFASFIRKKWSEHSTASGQKGTVVDELAVKPAGLVISDFYNTFVDQRTVNNIANWEDMSEAQMDFFGNKFFFPRIEGEFSFGSVRIRFNEKKNIEISSDARFVSNNGLEYRAVQPGYTNGASFKDSIDRISLYYLDVPVIAVSKGSNYNAEIGTISQITGVDFTYHSVTNPEVFYESSQHETNEVYYQRMRYSINDRSMMNKRSVFVRLPEFFPVINSMYIAAPGDRYMRRDLVSAMDISQPIQKADFLGKTQGENLVKHIAFFGIYPPNSGSFQKEYYGPFSIPTEYEYPLTIEPSDLSSLEPGFRGYPLSQEYTNEMYRGLFFDEYKNFSEVATVDLFNIEDEEVGFEPIVVPNTDWSYGASGLKRGNMGELHEGVRDIDIINFVNNDITIAGGAKSSVSVSKDILKRTGIKLSGSVRFPAPDGEWNPPARSNLQIMIGGINGASWVDGYTGVGFGVRLTNQYKSETEDPDMPNNAIVYFAHGEKYDGGMVFAADEDFVDSSPTPGHISATSLNALAETEWRIEPGVDYDFEFILHDDLRLTLYLNKTDNRIFLDENEKENNLHFKLPSTMLNVYSKELLNKNTQFYGTTMKITLDTKSETSNDQWVVKNLRAFDTQQSRATSLYAIDVSQIKDPISIYLRAFGQGSLDGVLSEGYTAYIWDKETSTIATTAGELTSGGWRVLEGISNPSGSKDVLTSLLRHTIENMDRYRIDSRYGDNIFIMLVSSGAAKSNSDFFNNTQDDIHARLQVDYISVQSDEMEFFHTNSKSDLIVSTVKNAEEIESDVVILTKTVNETYFEMNSDNAKMPIDEILSVTIGTINDESEYLSNTEYNVVKPNALMTGSAKETVRIILDNSNADTITVEYRTYPEVARMQDFFDGSQFEKIYGDILVRHSFPTYLTFTVNYTGNVNEDQLVSEIKEYVDQNITGTFSIANMISYLYNQELVNNVQEPITIAYSKYDDENNIVTGTFNDKLQIREIDYFRILDLTVNRL